MTVENQITRKDFLKKAGMTVASVAVTGTLLSACSADTTASADTSQAPEWPFTYTKIDPAVAEERAYKAYHEKGG